MAEGEAGSATQKSKRLVTPIIILVIALVFLIWMAMLFMSPAIYDDFGFDISKENWVYIGSIIMIILIAVLLVAAYPSRAPAPQTSTQAQFTSVPQATGAPAQQAAVVTTASTETAEEMSVVEAEPLVVEAEIVEAEPVEEEEKKAPSDLMMKKPRLVEYPKKVPGGVYGDTIVRMDAITKLNLRTLLVRSCLICDRQGKCWEEIQDTIPRDDFLANIDCKRGLREIKGPKPVKRPFPKKKKVVKMKVKPKPFAETVTEVTEVEPE
jgi:hypothetical protein